MAGGDWKPIETAPRDGTWLVLEGEFDGGDTSSTRIGRWEPRCFPIGDQSLEYEWLVFDEQHESIDGDAKPEWNWYCEGRVSGWRNLPEIGEAA